MNISCLNYQIMMIQRYIIKIILVMSKSGSNITLIIIVSVKNIMSLILFLKF